MSADLLRRAAKALRARADNLPGAMGDRSWFIVQGDSESLDVVAACAEHTEDETRACDGCWTTETPHERAADYIALMHPPVALALADWLEAVEYTRTPYRCPDPQCGDSTWDHDCNPQPVVTAEGERAVAVARAILREPEVTP